MRTAAIIQHFIQLPLENNLFFFAFIKANASITYVIFLFLTFLRKTFYVIYLVLLKRTEKRCKNSTVGR